MVAQASRLCMAKTNALVELLELTYTKFTGE
jgi:hypothetical protein